MARQLDCLAAFDNQFLCIIQLFSQSVSLSLVKNAAFPSVFLQEFEFDDWEELCDKLNALATDCNKHRAKTDKRKQRSVFRDVLKAVEVGMRKHLGSSGFHLHFQHRFCLWPLFFSPPSIFFQEGEFQSETIRFGTERMTIDSWVRKRTYDAFREFVGSGMNYHLQVPFFLISCQILMEYGMHTSHLDLFALQKHEVG